MRVLLLGASGLLGHNVLQRLVGDGHKVVAVVRRAGAARLAGVDYEDIVGRIDDAATVVAAAKGCEAIINCAGVTDMSLRRREDYQPVNVTLCSTIVEAMNTHGIRRLVHVSTVNTIGYGTAAHPAAEQEPVKPPFDRSYYAGSKHDGENIVRDAAALHPDWHVVVVNPGYMIGPMDVKPSSGRMLLMAYRKRLMVAPRGGKSFVDVRDVAAAVVNALTMGASGDRYIAVNSHAQLSVSEMYRLQASTMGYRQHVLVLPDALLAVAGCLGDVLRCFGIRTELSTRNVRQLMVCEYYDNTHAIRDLSMPETPIVQSVRDFHAWQQLHSNRKKRP